MLVGLATIGGLIIQFGQFSKFYQERYSIQVTFPDATGVIKGGPVKLAGADVGRVGRDPGFDSKLNAVVVELEIYKQVRIPRASTFVVGSSGILGDAYIDIQRPASKSEDFIEPGETVTGSFGAGLKGVTEQLKQTAKTLDEALDNVKDVSSDLQTTVGKINDEVLGDDNLEKVKNALGSLEEASKKVADVSAELKPMFADAKEAVSNAKEGISSAKELVEDLKPGIEDLKGAMANARTTVKLAGTAIDQIMRGDGLLTALLKDEALREDFVKLIGNMRARGIIFYKDKPKPEPAKRRFLFQKKKK